MEHIGKSVVVSPDKVEHSLRKRNGKQKREGVEKLHTFSNNLEGGGEAREGDKNGARRTSKIEIFLRASRTSKGER